MTMSALTQPRRRLNAAIATSIITADDHRFAIPEFVHDLATFREWLQSDDFPEGPSISFLEGGILVDMSYEEITTHAMVKTAIVGALNAINEADDLGVLIGDGARLSNIEADVSNEPDVVFVTYESIESKKATFTPRKKDPEQSVELLGTPDLVVEIVSDSSVRKDTAVLRSNYHTAGIPEYWLVDARGDQISFQVLNHRQAGYAAASTKHGWTRSRILDRDFRLTRKKNRVGMWSYRLETRDK
jgi:Uma2 family endonuclease